jgi:hypothetical protein
MYNSDVSEQFLVFQLKKAGMMLPEHLRALKVNLEHYYTVQRLQNAVTQL